VDRPPWCVGEEILTLSLGYGLPCGAAGVLALNGLFQRSTRPPEHEREKIRKKYARVSRVPSNPAFYPLSLRSRILPSSVWEEGIGTVSLACSEENRNDGGRDSPGNSSPIPEFEVLRITAGLGCPGDIIAMTAATQPSIEDILTRADSLNSTVTLHNPLLAQANGGEFMKPFHQTAEGRMDNFMLVVERSFPNEHNKEEGYRAFHGQGTKDRSSHHHVGMDRSSRFQGVGSGGGWSLRYLRRHSRHRRLSRGCMGVPTTWGVRPPKARLRILARRVVDNPIFASGG
jgi:hypothetical protein